MVTLRPRHVTPINIYVIFRLSRKSLVPNSSRKGEFENAEILKEFKHPKIVEFRHKYDERKYSPLEKWVDQSLDRKY